MFKKNFSLLKCKGQMGNKLCVNLFRYAAQVYAIYYSSAAIYTSIN